MTEIVIHLTMILAYLKNLNYQIFNFGELDKDDDNIFPIYLFSKLFLLDNS